MYMRLIFLCCIILLGVAACTGQKQEGSLEDVGSGIVLHGVYQTILPCADCKGIDFHVQIDSDYTYHSFSRYIGQKGHVFSDSGNWEWMEDTIIQLHSAMNDHKCFSVHGNTLHLLDRECKWFKSEFEKQYTLTLMDGVTDVHTLPTSERLSSFYHNLYLKGQSLVAKGDMDNWILYVGVGKSIVWKMGKDSLTYPYGSFEFTKEGKQIRSAAGKCVVDVRDERFVHPKTGEVFFATVSVNVEGKEYKGGANYLFDDHIESNWSLVKIDEKVIDVTEFPKPPTLLIKDQRISGFSGCNKYGGTVIIAGNLFITDKMFSTRMACINMSGEDRYMKLMEKVKSYEVLKNRLVLKDENNTNVLEFQVKK